VKLASGFRGLVLALVIGTTLTVATITGATALRDHYRHLLETAHTLGSMTAILAAPALQRGDAAALRRGMAALAGQSLLAYGAVYDPDGRVFVRVGPAPVRLAPPTPAPSWWQALRRGLRRLPVRQPVFAADDGRPWQAIGYVELGMSLAAFRRQASDYLLAAAVVTGVAALLGFVSSLWLGRRLERPLRRLTGGLTAVGEGRAVRPLPPEGPAEVRRLTEAFNRQLDWLEAQRERERQARAGLKAQVARRTESLRQMIDHAHTLAKEAQAASQAKSRFLANVSHELRTPLNAILGFMELLLATELRSEARHYVRLAREAAQALLQLIEDLLDVTKIEAGQLALRRQPFDLAALVASVVELHRPLAESKQLALGYRCPPDLPRWRYGDEGRIRQVLGNLVHNALKFTEWGEVTVSVAGDGERVTLEVRDTGIGLQAEDRERIFEPFTQVDDDANRHRGGTGLGLSICRQLVESMGGTITVTSQRHRGSRFTVTLPLPPAPEGTAAEAPPEAEPGPLHGRVLVVEDDRLNRALLTEMLKHLGCQAEAVADAATLWPRWRRGRYDLILLDCQLPGVDGFEIARQLRRRDPQRHTPIVAVTADVSDGIQARCRSAGMDGCLHKPVTLAGLRACLGRWLTGEAPPAAGSETDAGEREGSLFDAVILAQLQRLEASQNGLLERLFSLFQLQGGQWLQALEQALREGDEGRIRQVAHGFRSACLHLGIRDLVVILTRLEADAAAAPPLLACLWAGYRRTCCLFGRGTRCSR